MQRDKYILYVYTSYSRILHRRRNVLCLVLLHLARKWRSKGDGAVHPVREIVATPNLPPTSLTTTANPREMILASFPRARNGLLAIQDPAIERP